MGPTGPRGATGPQGVPGPTGPQGRQEMLDRLDRGPFGHQPGLQVLPRTQIRDVSGDLDTAEIGTLEPDSVVSWSRLEGNGNFLAGMKTDPGAMNHSAKSALSRHA
jgi:hypothetical protein